MRNNNKIVGMLGRPGDVKDWPSFIRTVSLLSKKMDNVSFWGVGVAEDDAMSRFGENAKCVEWKGVQPNGREWIREMDVFVLTSKHEELPTVVLEAFAERTAICGFIPVGGMEEILSYSQGSLRDVFIQERDSVKLAEIVMSLLDDDKKQKEVIEDGWQILVDHFDAVRNCRGQLMDVYRKVLAK